MGAAWGARHLPPWPPALRERGWETCRPTLPRPEQPYIAAHSAAAAAGLPAGRLFRSGSPAHASLEDVLLLRRELRVRCLLDFRSAEELAEDSAWSLMLSNGVIKTYGDYGQVVEVR